MSAFPNMFEVEMFYIERVIEPNISYGKKLKIINDSFKNEELLDLFRENYSDSYLLYLKLYVLVLLSNNSDSEYFENTDVIVKLMETVVSDNIEDSDFIFRITHPYDDEYEEYEVLMNFLISHPSFDIQRYFRLYYKHFGNYGDYISNVTSMFFQLMLKSERIDLSSNKNSFFDYSIWIIESLEKVIETKKYNHNDEDYVDEKILEFYKTKLPEMKEIYEYVRYDRKVIDTVIELEQTLLYEFLPNSEIFIF